MDAIGSIHNRISQIQSTIASLTAPVAGTPMTASATALTTTGANASTSAVFSAALDKAVGAQGLTPTLGGAPGAPTSNDPLARAAAAIASASGAVNTRGVPQELIAYGNGRIPAHALAGIEGTNHKLWEPAARSFEALRDAAKRDGVTIGITDSYRTYESQVDLVRRKGLYSQGGLAASPGTSNHGWGLALDLRLDAKAQSWMRANAKDFGFIEDVPREPWHWTFRPNG
ncbi:M15 family metallopeptidase [Cellulomonas bogoriensis]|uniref:Peptidase M15 n=1 Tax=Cellulomonas bogoriensis 69B4 = DSM 16987 TaxID=1386082 RepID=A0A0A0C3B0_9CELL|nr:M15 family metallopeptidase [Cellulomonas bogoriensis]KGM13839.1 peptidase M15 [Cellulomonas bogoriensis 69B4 = DSM 16987]